MNREMVDRIKYEMKRCVRFGTTDKKYDITNLTTGIDIARCLEYKYGIQLSKKENNYIIRVINRK